MSLVAISRQNIILSCMYNIQKDYTGANITCLPFTVSLERWKAMLPASRSAFTANHECTQRMHSYTMHTAPTSIIWQSAVHQISLSRQLHWPRWSTLAAVVAPPLYLPITMQQCWVCHLAQIIKSLYQNVLPVVVHRTAGTTSAEQCYHDTQARQQQSIKHQNQLCYISIACIHFCQHL